MKQIFSGLCLLVISLLLITGCSTGNHSGDTDSNMPQPQVRVELKPSPTPAPVLVTESTATAEATAVPTAAFLLYDPTPDAETIANDIQAMMDQIDSQLKAENFQLK